MVRRLSVTTTVNEFLDALPAKLMCGARAWTQHTYIGGEDVLDDVDARLKAEGLRRHADLDDRDRRRRAADRDRPHRRPLRRAARLPQRPPDPRRAGTATRRITAAVQYTLREDDVFPTGLVTTDLTRAYPALKEWQQWGLKARERPRTRRPPAPRCG